MNRENGAKGVPPAEEEIRRALGRYRMLEGASRVVVGLSGGADSMTLAHFLLRAGVPLLAAHVNHGLRGRDADGDERFVRSWCAENGVGLRVLRADVRKIAGQTGAGLEECGRRVRYRFLESLCGKNDRIATAHTLSDCAETVLLNLTRGCGVKGLSGIPPVRGRIIRPLIGVTRAQVEEYCAFYGLPYVTDRTNFSREYARNRIRLDVVPVLKGINPAFEQAVSRMTRLAAADDALLSGLAREKLSAAKRGEGYCARELARLPRPLLTRAAALAAHDAGYTDYSAEHICAAAAILRAGRGSVTAPGGLVFRVEGGLFFIGEAPPPQKEWMTPVQFPKTLTEDGREVIIKLISGEEYQKNSNKFHNLLFYNAVNYDTIKNNSIFRNRRSGDRFRPAGFGGTKSLKKLLNEKKIPPSRRSRLLLLESGGEILWIEGIGASQKARADGETDPIALIIIRSAVNDK